eukprot:13954187-Alexandrium_andersonii.AAC.1
MVPPHSRPSPARERPEGRVQVRHVGRQEQHVVPLELQPDFCAEEVASHWHEEQPPARPLRLQAAPGRHNALAAAPELWRRDEEATHLVGGL